MWLWLASCASPPPPCGAEACAEVCAAGAAGPDAADGRSALEEQLLADVVADIRAGVRPWADDAVGVCVGKKECKSFLGADAGALGPGDHLVKAELRVPAAGPKGTWKVRFETACTSSKAGAEPTVSTYQREYDVTYAGPDRGYRLMPLKMIESPSKEGPQACTWTLTALHPDGDRSWSGSWSVPGR